MSENEKVLLMDFQENSGLSRMLEQSVEHNLDELLVMAESGRYSTNRINSCIGRSISWIMYIRLKIQSVCVK